MTLLSLAPCSCAPNPALPAASSRVWGLRSEGLRGKQAEAPSGRDRLGPGVHLQLSEQAPQVIANRLGGERQLLRDLGCRPAGGDQVEDLPLARRQSRLRLGADGQNPRTAGTER